MQIQEEFISLCSRYNSDDRLISGLWMDIALAYSGSARHYHNLGHLEKMIAELKEIKEKIESWDLLLFSVFYHDLVYIPGHCGNEEKSAGLAGEALKKLGLEDEVVRKCRELILVTATHDQANDDNARYLIDADLSILGAVRPEYLAYTIAIQKEYGNIPFVIYREGRKNFLRQFLAKERIYQTPYFFNKYESSARENMRYELMEILD